MARETILFLVERMFEEYHDDDCEEWNQVKDDALPSGYRFDAWSCILKEELGPWLATQWYKDYYHPQALRAVGRLKHLIDGKGSDVPKRDYPKEEGTRDPIFVVQWISKMSRAWEDRPHETAKSIVLCFTRQEGAEWIRQNNHDEDSWDNYQVYCCCSEGELAKMLARHTDYSNIGGPVDAGRDV